jgi:hypothetical protein
MNKKHLVTLTEKARAALGQRVSAGRSRARELTHARILLKADSGLSGPGWTDQAISDAVDASRRRISSHWPAACRLKDMGVGVCGCWQGGWPR